MGLLDQLTPRQRQLAAGGLLLALGVTTGVVIAPDDPQRGDKLADIAANAGSSVAPVGKLLDAAEYHRAMIAARAGRANVTDLLSEEVAPGAFVVAQVSVAFGQRPVELEFIGPSAGAFTTACGGCGLSFEDHKSSAVAVPDITTIRLRAQNTSSETLRLTALLRHEAM